MASNFGQLLELQVSFGGVIVISDVVIILLIILIVWSWLPLIMLHVWPLFDPIFPYFTSSDSHFFLTQDLVQEMTRPGTEAAEKKSAFLQRRTSLIMTCRNNNLDNWKPDPVQPPGRKFLLIFSGPQSEPCTCTSTQYYNQTELWDFKRRQFNSILTFFFTNHLAGQDLPISIFQ